MPAIIKSVTAKVAAQATPIDGGDPDGTFTALVSVFGNEDLDGDVVEAGAFADSITAWADSDRKMPVLWSHQFAQLDAILGYYSEAKETDEGLRLKGHLDLDHEPARRVHQLMKAGIVTEFSWSGEVLEYDIIPPEDGEDDPWAMLFAGIRMRKIDLWEAGPCFKGANPETQLLGVKASDMAGPLGKRIRAQSHQLSDSDAAVLRALADANKTTEAPADPATSEDPSDTDQLVDEDDNVTPDPEGDDTSVQRERAAARARALLGLEFTH